MTERVQIIQDERGWFFHFDGERWVTRKTGEALLDTDEGPKGTTVAVVVGCEVQPGFAGFVGKVAMMLARQAYPADF